MKINKFYKILKQLLKWFQPLNYSMVLTYFAAKSTLQRCVNMNPDGWGFLCHSYFSHTVYIRSLFHVNIVQIFIRTSDIFKTVERLKFGEMQIVGQQASKFKLFPVALLNTIFANALESKYINTRWHELSVSLLNNCISVVCHAIKQHTHSHFHNHFDKSFFALFYSLDGIYVSFNSFKHQRANCCIYAVIWIALGYNIHYTFTMYFNRRQSALCWQLQIPHEFLNLNLRENWFNTCLHSTHALSHPTPNKNR